MAVLGVPLPVLFAFGTAVAFATSSVLVRVGALLATGRLWTLDAAPATWASSPSPGRRRASGW